MEDSTQVPGVSDALDKSADKPGDGGQARPSQRRQSARDAARKIRRRSLRLLVPRPGIRKLRRPHCPGLRPGEVSANVDPGPLRGRTSGMLRGRVPRRRAAGSRDPGIRRGPSAPAQLAAPVRSAKRGSRRNRLAAGPRRVAVGPSPAFTRTQVNGFEGSPLDPNYTFESFAEGKANRIAHAVATQVAAPCSTSSGVQPALPPFPGRARQDASAACHRLGGQAARAQRAGALPDGRALPLSVRGGRAQPGRHRLQGQVPRHRHPADRRSRVHARREDRAGVRAHHQRAARWRPPGRGRLGPSAGAARPPQRSHALAHAARPHHRDQRLRRGAAAQDPGAAGAGKAG